VVPIPAEFYRGVCGVNALAKPLDLSREAKIECGLLLTSWEIAQQPAPWESTFSLFQKYHTRFAAVLANAGLGDPKRPSPAAFLIGKGTSDYIGRSLVNALPDSSSGVLGDHESITNEQNN
jgi:hypothetical protein